MDKNLLIFIAFGVVAIYFLTDFIGDIQKDDDRFVSSESKKKAQYRSFIVKDSIGQKMLDVTGQPPEVQIKAWNESSIKEELIELFPDFGAMKIFAKDRVRGEVVSKKLLDQLDSVEGKFFSGTIDNEAAKRELQTLK